MYSSPQQPPQQAAQQPSMPSRTQAFGQGAYGAGQAQGNPSPSMNADSQQQNSMVPQQFQPHSVLQPYIQSANGMSTQDANRRLVGGGMLPSMNGTSAATYQESRPMQNNRINI